MPAQPQANAKTSLEIDRATHTIRLTRVFDASRVQIFEAWTKPEQVTCWWDAAGAPLTACEIDLRPGRSIQICHPEPPRDAIRRNLSRDNATRSSSPTRVVVSSPPHELRCSDVTGTEARDALGIPAAPCSHWLEKRAQSAPHQSPHLLPAIGTRVLLSNPTFSRFALIAQNGLLSSSPRVSGQ